MLKPTIDELTQGKFNRYELALATAKCARIVTEEYVEQHAAADRPSVNGREAGGIDRELRDEKAVKVAIGRLYNGVYEIDPNAGEKKAAEAEAEEAQEDGDGDENSADA